MMKIRLRVTKIFLQEILCCSATRTGVFLMHVKEDFLLSCCLDISDYRPVCAGAAVSLLSTEV